MDDFILSQFRAPAVDRFCARIHPETQYRRGEIKAVPGEQVFAKCSSSPGVIPARFHSAAEAEFTEAAEFYETAEPGLGRAFAQRGGTSSGANLYVSRGWAPFGTRVRGAIVVNFPFWVVYRAQAAQVLILAIARQRRRPGYWRKRKEAPR